LPEVAYDNIKACLENKIPVICGTTGWLDKKAEIEKLAVDNGTAFLYGSNFSLGVNLFFALNEKLADLMKNVDEYSCQLEEIHHIHKKDAPSGTAISIAEGLSITIRNLMPGNWKKQKVNNWEFSQFVKMKFRNP
jgi:4-hydroxy-tetrahydrodipicolinate reductase